MEPEPETFDVRYISYGAGVQSTALLVLSCLGLRGVPKADAACFSDTGDEPAFVYKYLEIIKPWAKSHGIEVHTCSKGHLSNDLIETDRRFASLPVWTRAADGRAAPLRRQCTYEYKIAPLEQWVRKQLGYIPRQRMKHKVQTMIGISLDEVSRCKPSRTKWVTNSYPLIDAHIHRPLCMEIIADAGLPPPSKSSCVFCPYHSDDFYRWLKEEHPEDFEKACLFDEAVRSKEGRYRGSVDSDPYIHRSLMPLREVDFTDNQLSLWTEECEGYCGV